MNIVIYYMFCKNQCFMFKNIAVLGHPKDV